MIELLFDGRIIGTGIIIGLIYYLIKFLTSDPSKQEPPGPWGLPIVGFLPFLGRKANITLTNLQPKYGDVFQIRIGGRKIVVICGQRAIREAMNNKGNDFSGRPDFYTYKAGFGAFGEAGYTPAFKIHKKLTMKSMNAFAGVRRKELEQVAYQAADMLLETLEGSEGQPLEPKPHLYASAWAIMGYMCYGRPFTKEDPQVQKVFSTVSTFAKTMMFGVLVDYFPWAKWIMRKQLAQFDDLMANIDDVARKLAAETVDTYREGDQRSISDVFREACVEMSPEEKRNLQIDDEKLKGVATSLFGAGFGTIAATMRWGLMLLAKNHDIQDKLREELDRVVGRDHYPDLDDMNRLPYCLASIAEIYRWSSMSALGITHATICDTTLDGYFIAKGTPIVLNLFSAHRDESVFPEPEEFRPDRFLHPDGSLNKAMVEQIMPYGLGARRCGGEPIARLEIFLFLTTIIQRCFVLEDPANPLDPYNYFFGLGIDLKPFKLVFKSRKKD